MSLITAFLESNAAAKENRLRQRLLDQGAALSRDEFNRRMAELAGSDTRLIDLAKQQYTDESGNEDRTFADLLANAHAGFDEQSQISDETANERLGIEKTAFDQQMEALGGLITAQRGTRLKMQEAQQAELARQRGFQGQADELAAALPGQVGYDAQEAGRAKSFADRVSLINSTISAPGAAPAWAKDPTTAAAYANADTRGADLGRGDAAAAARIGAYGDAFQGSERTMGGFADKIGELTTKAQISRDALPAELGVGKLEGEQAGERADFATSLAKSLGDRRDQIAADRGAGRSGNSERYRTATGGARKDYGSNLARVLADYFGTRSGAETGFINGITDSSQTLENKLLNLNNFKMGNTRVTSPLANTNRMIEQALLAAAGGGGGG